MHQDLDPIATPIREDVCVMRVSGPEYPNDAHQHSFGSGAHIQRRRSHPNRVDSNHLKSARTNSAHSETEPETETRNSPRSKWRSSRDVGQACSGTSDSRQMNSGSGVCSDSGSTLPPVPELLRYSVTQRRKRLAFMPFASAILAVETPGAAQALISWRLKSLVYRPRFLIGGHLMSDGFIYPSRI